MLDAGGVLADEQRLEMLDGPDHGQLAPGEAGLADAVDALVGVYHDEQKVPVSSPDGERFDVGDLHGRLLACQRMDAGGILPRGDY